MMESINCPVLGCSYSTPANTDAAVVAALLTLIQQPTTPQTPLPKVRKSKTHNINCRLQRGVGLLRDEMGRLQNSNGSDRSRMRSTAVRMLR